MYRRLGCLALALAGCGGATGDTEATTGPGDGACDLAITPPAMTTARLQIGPDGALFDEHGRRVILRGINTGGRSKWAPFLPFPIDPEAGVDEVRAAADVFYGRLVDWGLDTVRMPLSWEALEPAEGAYDGRYLDRYEAMVDAAWAHGLRVIVDFHQDVYASPYCGDGFPLWTLEDPDPGPARRDCPQWFLGYVNNTGVRAAFDHLWADDTGVQTQLFAMWAEVAGRLASHPGVVGFELINEPGWGTAADVGAWKRDVLAPFYAALAAELRALAPDALILYDNPGIDALGVAAIEHARPQGEGFVYAPHLYDSGLINGLPWTGADPTPVLEDMVSFARGEGLPLLLGEFGVAQGAAGGEAWMTLIMAAIDASGTSATLWEYSQNEEPWNAEDLSVVDASGEPRAGLDRYVRPWLRAVAGDDASFAWDPALGRFEASWTAGDGVTEVVLPPRRFTGGLEALSVTGDGACHSLDLAAGRLWIRASAGAAVQLSFTAAP